MKPPLCTAAHTALLVDVDKGVRPCCTYIGEHIPGKPSVGNLRDRTLPEILDGEAWQAVRAQLEEGLVPPGCAKCIEREERSGGGQRRLMESVRPEHWRNGITYIELNTSNVCNLRCRHCSSLFSTRWSKHEARHGRDGHPVVMPDAGLLTENLRRVDLQWLDRIVFKGGEPMLNADCVAALRYLDEAGVLPRVTIQTVTNATTVNEEFLELAARAKSCRLRLSIDGVGRVQTYIRDGGSDIAKCEEAIARYAAMPNSVLLRSTSVMVYNVHTLDQIDDWWRGLAQRFPGNYPPHEHDWFVMWPQWLDVACLTDATRGKLFDQYSRFQGDAYGKVLGMLCKPFAGAGRHNEFVRKTEQMDREFGTRWQDSVPELEDEMTLLPE